MSSSKDFLNQELELPEYSFIYKTSSNDILINNDKILVAYSENHSYEDALAKQIEIHTIGKIAMVEFLPCKNKEKALELCHKRGFNKVEHYITIEVGVKNMPYEQSKTSLHKKTHVLLLCYHFQWHELEYIKNRREDTNVQMYKSQENRYVDVQ